MWRTVASSSQATIPEHVITIVEQVSRRLVPGKGLAKLLGRPRRRWMRGDRYVSMRRRSWARSTRTITSAVRHPVQVRESSAGQRHADFSSGDAARRWHRRGDSRRWWPPSSIPTARGLNPRRAVFPTRTSGAYYERRILTASHGPAATTTRQPSTSREGSRPSRHPQRVASFQHTQDNVRHDVQRRAALQLTQTGAPVAGEHVAECAAWPESQSAR
jgi:hypothetical protein